MKKLDLTNKNPYAVKTKAPKKEPRNIVRRPLSLPPMVPIKDDAIGGSTRVDDDGWDPASDWHDDVEAALRDAGYETGEASNGGAPENGQAPDSLSP